MPRYRTNYPETVQEVLSDEMQFKKETINAMLDFKRSRPWSGTVQEKKRKFDTLLTKLSKIYNIRKPTLVVAFTAEDNRPLSSGTSSYSPSTHTITIRGKFSVITFLHEFTHARGYDERYSCKWSINLFKKIFPREFLRLGGQRHCLVLQPVMQRKITHHFTFVRPYVKRSIKKRRFGVRGHKRRL